MNFELDKLVANLDKLTGADFEDCERAERNAGNMTPVISFSSSFQGKLAALALDTNPHELRNLPIVDFNQIIGYVSNFLFSNLDSDIIELPNIKLQRQTLLDGLQNLTGANFEDCERAERNAGNMTPVISFSASFQTALAAIALDVDRQIIRTLSIPKYNQIVAAVSTFLFSSSVSTSTSLQTP